MAGKGAAPFSRNGPDSIMDSGTPVRLCLKDLFAQDVLEMIERETRRYELECIEHPDHPDFHRAWQILWDAFGEAGEMEQEDVVRQMLLYDRFTPSPTSGTFIRYFFIVARDQKTGEIRGVRDGRVLVNAKYAPDVCVVYLSHIFMLPEARGSVLTYWLRIAPVELAVEFLWGLHQRGMFHLPAPDAPGRYYGMTIDLAAEVEFYSPDDRLSLQRILFYGRGGFDVIDPRHFPYAQPDFRSAEEVAATGDRPHPCRLLLRRMGRERQARLPIQEARAVMDLIYDDFEIFAGDEYLQTTLDVVLDRLDARAAAGKTDVALLPLPTGPHDLGRLRRIFRWDVYRRYYPRTPIVEEYLEGPVRDQIAANPRWFEEELARTAAAIAAIRRRVYPTRERGFEIDPESGLAVEPAGR